MQDPGKRGTIFNGRRRNLPAPGRRPGPRGRLLMALLHDPRDAEQGGAAVLQAEIEAVNRQLRDLM